MTKNSFVAELTFKFSINGSFCWGTQNIKFTICNAVLLLQVKVLVKLLSIEQFIKDANSMNISFSVKHPKAFQKSWLSLPNMSRIISNMYTYPFNPQLLIKTQVESHDKKPKDQRNIYNIYTWPIAF